MTEYQVELAPTAPPGQFLHRKGQSHKRYITIGSFDLTADAIPATSQCPWVNSLESLDKVHQKDRYNAECEWRMRA
jgi:hypothetical protein